MQGAYLSHHLSFALQLLHQCDCQSLPAHCSVAVGLQITAHHPLFTSSAPHLLSLFTFTLGLSSSLPSFIRAFLLLSVHPSPSLQLSLSHHTATILGSNWLNNTFRLPKTSTGKVFPPSVIKLWSDHDGFVPARMIHLQYIGLCMPTTVLFCLRYTINSKL